MTEKEALVLLTQLEDGLAEKLGEIMRALPSQELALGQARWLAIAKTHFDQGFMAAKRAVCNGKRTDE